MDRGEWLKMASEAGLIAGEVTTDRLPLEYTSWIARMRTPEHFAVAIRELQKVMSDDVVKHYEIQPDGTFTSDIMMLVASKN